MAWSDGTGGGPDTPGGELPELSTYIDRRTSLRRAADKSSLLPAADQPRPLTWGPRAEQGAERSVTEWSNSEVGGEYLPSAPEHAPSPGMVNPDASSPF